MTFIAYNSDYYHTTKENMRDFLAESNMTGGTIRTNHFYEARARVPARILKTPVEKKGLLYSSCRAPGTGKHPHMDI